MANTDPQSKLAHRDMIDRAGGIAELGRKIGVDPNTVKAWKRLDSIPAAYWARLSREGVATLTELAEAAALKRAPSCAQDAA